jgi:cytochrome c5
MRSSTARRIAVAAFATILIVHGAVRGAMAQEAAPGAGSQSSSPARDPYQRSLETYEFKKAAASGPERGREIFYYKCWFCRGTLLSGLPVNNDTVKDRIRNGGEGMAAYRYALSEADLDDLVSFVREKCCWNSDAPPANPRYRAR